MKELIILEIVFVSIFYMSLIAIGWFYDFKLALFLFIALISYQGFISTKAKYKKEMENEN